MIIWKQILKSKNGEFGMNKLIIIAITAVITAAITVGVFFLIGSSAKVKYVRGDTADLEEVLEYYRWRDGLDEPSWDVFEIGDTILSMTGATLEKDYIPDEQTAAEIGAAILKSVYGESIRERLPFVVFFNEERQEWLVRSQTPKRWEGVVGFIVLKKSNAEVVAIWMG